MTDLLMTTLGPLHPPLTHFPIVCSILAVLCLGAHWRSKKPWWREAAAWLWVLTFLSGSVSGLTGHLFSLHQGLEGSFSWIPSGAVMGGLLRDHVLWAMGGLAASTLCLVAAWKILKGRPWPQGVQWGAGLATAVLFGLAGSHGGEMVYGPGMGGKTAPEAKSDLLEVSKAYRKDLVKVNHRPWVSRTHGKRWVNTFVSKQAVAAYHEGGELPEGSLVVKESFEDSQGKPSPTEGPLYVMRKGDPGSANDGGGWEYAVKWERPVPGNPEGFEGPLRLLPGDAGLASCLKCHGRFKSTDYLGGIPEEGEAP